MFYIYNNYYKMRLFTKADMDTFVLAGMLTAEDEVKIVGVAGQPA